MNGLYYSFPFAGMPRFLAHLLQLCLPKMIAQFLSWLQFGKGFWQEVVKVCCRARSRLTNVSFMSRGKAFH